MPNHINDMINASRDKNPNDFEKAFNLEIQSRVGEAISERKASVVADIFGVQLPSAESEASVETAGSEE